MDRLAAKRKVQTDDNTTIQANYWNAGEIIIAKWRDMKKYEAIIIENLKDDVVVKYRKDGFVDTIRKTWIINAERRRRMKRPGVNLENI